MAAEPSVHPASFALDDHRPKLQLQHVVATGSTRSSLPGNSTWRRARRSAVP